MLNKNQCSDLSFAITIVHEDIIEMAKSRRRNKVMIGHYRRVAKTLEGIRRKQCKRR